MIKRLAAVLLLVALVFSPSATAKPVFDCTKPEIRRAYPAQCPELGDPLIGGGHGGSGSCTGLCGVVRGVLDTIGLGGIL